jgi:hypothetical protein
MAAYNFSQYRAPLSDDAAATAATRAVETSLKAICTLRKTSASIPLRGASKSKDFSEIAMHTTRFDLSRPNNNDDR